MKNSYDLKFLYIFSLILLVFSCKKETLTDDIEATNDNSFAEAAYADVSNLADQAGAENALTSYKTDATGNLLSKCAVLSLLSLGNSNLLTINFGPVNCLCNDGNLRRGKIIISFTGQYRDSASTHNISFSNYYLNDYQIDGSKTVINLGHNSAGNSIFSIIVNGNITNPSGKTLSWNSNRSREWIAGENTTGILGLFDDVYSIKGSANGSSFNGIPFSASISDPLIVALNCRWIKQGKFEFTPGTAATRYFDFGSGSCDNKATVTVNGNTYDIVLR